MARPKGPVPDHGTTARYRRGCRCRRCRTAWADYFRGRRESS